MGSLSLNGSKFMNWDELENVGDIIADKKSMLELAEVPWHRGTCGCIQALIMSDEIIRNWVSTCVSSSRESLLVR